MDERRSGGFVIRSSAPHLFRIGSSMSVPVLGELVFQTFREVFDQTYHEGTMSMLTVHPQIIGDRSRIGNLEKFIDYVKSKPGLWFANGKQIADFAMPVARAK